MSSSYEPEEPTRITPELLARAKELNCHIVQIHCDPSDIVQGDPRGISFLSLSGFLPRAGELITLEDGKKCKVNSVSYRVASVGSPMLLADVYAVEKQ